MFAVTADRIDADDPLAGLATGERADPSPPPGWTTVSVKAASLNHHDVWTLRGVGISADRLPIVLGCDAAGLDEDGNEVVIHAVVGDPDAGAGDETLDPSRSLLSERYDGTFADRVAVPRRNLLPKPACLSFAEAACLPTAYLSAYRMLFGKAGLQPGATVLVQGAGGGVATALILLGRAAGYRVWATSRSEVKRERAIELGADQAFPSGARLPERVDAVLETVGEATWAHSLRALKPGGTIVISGATSGSMPPAELSRVFFLQLSVIGSTMGTRDQLGRLLRFCEQTGVRPRIDRTLPRLAVIETDHQKGEPFVSRIIAIHNIPPYSAADIVPPAQEEELSPEELQKLGWRLVPAADARVAGLNNLRRYTFIDPERPATRPRFLWMDTPGNRACLAQVAKMPLDPKNPEDALKIDYEDYH
jgi:NADPH:quinone reductase-like Zn-dependent oxidoreductase